MVLRLSGGWKCGEALGMQLASNGRDPGMLNILQFKVEHCTAKPDVTQISISSPIKKHWQGESLWLFFFPAGMGLFSYPKAKCHMLKEISSNCKKTDIHSPGGLCVWASLLTCSCARFEQSESELIVGLWLPEETEAT